MLLDNGQGEIELVNSSREAFLLEKPRLLENSASVKIEVAPKVIRGGEKLSIGLSAEREGQALLIVCARLLSRPERSIDLTSWIISWAREKEQKAEEKNLY